MFYFGRRKDIFLHTSPMTESTVNCMRVYGLILKHKHSFIMKVNFMERKRLQKILRSVVVRRIHLLEHRRRHLFLSHTAQRSRLHLLLHLRSRPRSSTSSLSFVCFSNMPGALIPSATKNESCLYCTTHRCFTVVLLLFEEWASERARAPS